MTDNFSLITEYALRHSTAEDSVLNRLYRETNLKTVYPHMLSGHLQGKLLEMISHMIRPDRVLEIGTFTGYSAICLARGLSENGLLHTIDINDELTEMALKYFGQAGLTEKIIVHTGDAREIIPGLRENFDLVFIDGDKEQYLEYYQQSMKTIKTGGFIIADNVLWGGKVLPGYAGRDKETAGIAEFNRFIADDPRVEKILLPFRDGWFILRKIA
ncbi:MAG: O-methyltransferase [Bacteroidales bacterium]|nr:O-methyltransferase [Bacteroidales bacterium]